MKLFVVAGGHEVGVWADPADLSMFLEDEAALRSLDPETLTAIGQEPGRTWLLQAALAEARRVGQVRAPGDVDPGPAEGVHTGRGTEPGAQRVVGAERALSGGRETAAHVGDGNEGVNAVAGVSTPEGVNTGADVLMRDEAERRRKGKRKADVSLDEEIETEEEEGSALIRRTKRVKETPRRERLGDGPGVGGPAVAQRVAEEGPRGGGVIGAVPRSLRLEAAVDTPEGGHVHLSNLGGGSFAPAIQAPGERKLPTEGGASGAAESGESDEDDAFGSGRIVARGRRLKRSRIVSDDEAGEDGAVRQTSERTLSAVGVFGRHTGNSAAGQEAVRERTTSSGPVRTAPTACEDVQNGSGADGDAAAQPTLKREPPTGNPSESAPPCVGLRGSPGVAPDPASAARRGAPPATTPGVKPEPKSETFAPTSPPPRVRSPASTGRAPERRGENGEAGRSAGAVSETHDPVMQAMAPQAEGPVHGELPRASGSSQEQTALVAVLEEVERVNGPVHEEPPRGSGPYEDRHEGRNVDADLERYGEEGLELRARLQAEEVPAPTIERLLEAGFTMVHLRLGLLARRELLPLVKDQLLQPAEHFGLPTLMLLDRASRMHMSA